MNRGGLVTLVPFFSLSLFPQTQTAVTSIITARWWFKPGSAFTPTTPTSAAPLVTVLREHTSALLRRAAPVGDAGATNPLGFGKSWWPNQPKAISAGVMLRYGGLKTMTFHPVFSDLHLGLFTFTDASAYLFLIKGA